MYVDNNGTTGRMVNLYAKSIYPSTGLVKHKSDSHSEYIFVYVTMYCSQAMKCYSPHQEYSQLDQPQHALKVAA